MTVECKITKVALINNLKKVNFKKTSNKTANSKMKIKKEEGVCLIMNEEMRKIILIKMIAMWIKVIFWKMQDSMITPKCLKNLRNFKTKKLIIIKIIHKILKKFREKNNNWLRKKKKLTIEQNNYFNLNIIYMTSFSLLEN